jgi:hypothetical protein
VTTNGVALFFLALWALEVGVGWVLLRRIWPQARAFYSRLDRFQKMALAVTAFGLVTAYLLAFSSGASFGAGHLGPPRCFTVVAFSGDREAGSTNPCLDEKNDGLSVPLPAGVTRIVILDSKGSKRLSYPTP